MARRAATFLERPMTSLHGIGQLKRDVLPHHKSAIALDPLGLMNPGKLLQAQA
jgi:FAD/FMN-containing dehydrogenase